MGIQDRDYYREWWAKRLDQEAAAAGPVEPEQSQEVEPVRAPRPLPGFVLWALRVLWWGWLLYSLLLLVRWFSKLALR